MTVSLGWSARPIVIMASLAMIGLAGCSGSGSMPMAPPIPATDGDTAMDEASYRMQIGDVLAIRLPLMPDFNEETTIRPDGRISTAFAADVKAAGRTVPELTAALRDGYSREMRSPLISVNVKTYSPYRVYVAGEVVAPGEYQSQGPNLTLSQAITRAGGPKLSGAPADVFILRRGDGDRPIVMAANYKEVLHGTNPAADVRLARYDVVFVPRTTVAEMYIFFNQYLQQFVPVTWGFNYLLNNGSSSTAVK